MRICIGRWITLRAGVADNDIDGYIDLYIGKGHLRMSRLEPNRVPQQRRWHLSDVTNYVGGLARPGDTGLGLVFVDIANDGDLEEPGANQNNWLELDLACVKSNRFGTGAKLTVKEAK